MKFKKILAAVSSAALSLTMFTAMNVSADDIDGGDPSSRPYSFEYTLSINGAYVSSVEAAAGITEIEIPDETESGIKVVGVEGFAFAMCDDLKTVVLPDTLQLDFIDPAAFLTFSNIEDFLERMSARWGGTDCLAYIANEVSFMGKNDWEGTEEELASANTVLDNVRQTLGYDEDISYDEAARLIYDMYILSPEDRDLIVRYDDKEDLTRMSPKTFLNFCNWVGALPYADLTVKANEDTDAAKYAKGREILGMKYEVKETHLVGDANQDGVVNVRDCAKIANALAFKTVDQLCLKCADYNEDGEVTVRDAAQLAAFLAKVK